MSHPREHAHHCPPGELIHVCVECGKPTTTRCKRCQGEWYCSTACQRTRWPSHKAECAAGITDYQRGMQLENTWLGTIYEQHYREQMQEILATTDQDLVITVDLNVDLPATQPGKVTTRRDTNFEEYLDYCAGKVPLHGDYFPGRNGMAHVAEGIRASRAKHSGRYILIHVTAFRARPGRNPLGISSGLHLAAEPLIKKVDRPHP